MVWKDDIKVSLTMSGGFRIGSGRAGLEVDLPVVRESLPDGENSYYTSNLSSTFRGVLRQSVHRMIQSTGLSSKASLEEELFGTWVKDLGTKPKEGKLQIKLEPSSEPIKALSRTGIRIDEKFGVVAPQALFTYEILEGIQKQITLRFKLTCSFPFNDDEASVLLAGLNGLLYDSIGGFASRGLGLIEKVEIAPEFKNFAGQHLKKKISEKVVGD